MNYAEALLMFRDIRLNAAMKSPEANNAYCAPYNAGRKDAFADARDAEILAIIEHEAQGWDAQNHQVIANAIRAVAVSVKVAIVKGKQTPDQPANTDEAMRVRP